MSKKSVSSECNENILSEYLGAEPVTLGIHTSYTWRNDPKHILFSLSRYKFCAKLLQGKDSVLEVGCGDGFGVPILLQSVNKMTCVDIEPAAIESCKNANICGDRVSFSDVDLVCESPEGTYDAVVSMDTIEHIDLASENKFLSNMFSPIADNGIAIIGTPNKCAAQYASPISNAGHINLKDASSLRSSILKFFDNVFIFSMNDEIVHTGFYPMAHYLIALATNKKTRP